MEITSHVAAIRGALEAVAGDDPAARAVAERLAQAVGPAVQLQLLDLLGQVALEVSAQLPSGRVDVQLAGRDVLLVVAEDLTGAPSPAGAPVDDGGDTARLTLRMSDALKSAVEQAASQEGLSTNAWLVNAARHALQPTRGRRRGPSAGSRISGFTQS